jgi:hypothetical protein
MIIANVVDCREIYSAIFREYYDWGERLRKDGLPGIGAKTHAL